jgi:hypothetical protein
MKRNNILTAVLIAAISYCSHAALAVSDFVIGMYDADAGNPANAGEIQSPELQGWTEWASGVQGQDPNLAVQEGVIGNDSTNAWLNDDQLGNTNPGYFIDVDAATQRGMFDFGWKYENVMTMTRGDHFTAFGVSSSNPWGLASNSRVGFEPGTNGSTITFAPIDDGSAATIVTPSGTVGDFYRVVVTGDAQATSGTFEVFDFSTGSQEGVTQDYTGWTTGSSNNANRLGIQSGSSSGDNRTAQIHSMSLVIPAPDTLTLEVNKISGATRLVNNSSSVIIFNGYFIESAGNQLDLNAWASLQSIDLDGNGTPDDGIGWEEFDASGTAILAEAFFTGSSTLSPSGSLDLGNAYNPAIAGVGNDGDLSFKLTDTAGRLIPSSLFSTVEYVTDGDFDGDNDIDGSDFLTWQRGFPTPPHDTAGLALWEANYGAGAGQLAIINAVPEPGGLVLLSVGVVLLRFRCTPA